MTNKPSRQPEVLAIIERYGPITTAAIADLLNMPKGSVNYHLTQLGKAVHVGGWESTLSSAHQTRWSAKWTAGPGENTPMPKGLPCQDRDRVVIDLDSMPYRSVFAGGVSPWSGMTA